MSQRATMRWRTERAATGSRGGRVRGFLAWRCEPGGRMTIVQFHIDRPYRQRGGRAAAARRRARGGAPERSSANHPAITAARRLGFEICGFDTTLYPALPSRARSPCSWRTRSTAMLGPDPSEETS